MRGGWEGGMGGGLEHVWFVTQSGYGLNFFSNLGVISKASLALFEYTSIDFKIKNKMS